MTDYAVMLILFAAALSYVSLLLTIRLRSLGMGRGRVARVIVEVWATFALIIAAFALAQRLVGPTPRGSIAGELAAQLDSVRRLSAVQRLAVYGGLSLAVMLFAHLLWMLRALPRTPRAAPSEGGSDDPVA